MLLGRDPAKTARVAQDLRIRSAQSAIAVETTDFLDPAKIREWVDQVCAAGVPDIVLIAHGSLPDQKECQQDLLQNQQVLQLNGVSPVLFAEGFAGHMEKADKGTLAIISSVAGERGRKSNYVYGAAKGLVTRYSQGLQHRLAKTNINVILIKPGPTDTPMTAHLKSAGVKLSAVDQVARDIVIAIKKGQLTVYTPKIWSVIMMIIRHIPNSIFGKLDI